MSGSGKIIVTIELEVPLMDRRDYAEDLGEWVTIGQAAAYEAQRVHAEDNGGGSDFRVTGWRVEPPDPWEGAGEDAPPDERIETLEVDPVTGMVPPPGPLTGSAFAAVRRLRELCAGMMDDESSEDFAERIRGDLTGSAT